MEIKSGINPKNESERIEMLKAVESELYCIPNSQVENRLQDNPFYFIENEAGMQCEFYHKCRILNILCHVEVNTIFGIVDAVIRIGDSFYMIEFKNVDVLTADEKSLNKETKHQLRRYLKNKQPIILINDINDIDHILMLLRMESVPLGAYRFCKIDYKLISCDI